MLLAMALGLGWRLAIEGIHPIPQGTWDLFLPHGHFQRAVCAICGLGGFWGDRLWSETADVLSAAAGCFLPLPQPFKARRVSCVSERGSPRLPRMETSMRGWVWSCRPLSSPEHSSGAWDTELPPHPTPSQKASTLSSGGEGRLERVGPSVFPSPAPTHFECREPSCCGMGRGEGSPTPGWATCNAQPNPVIPPGG